MGELVVKQDGNRIDLSFAGHDIWIEVSGIELPVLQDYSFAAWMLLPLAMQKNEPLHIKHPVDPLVIENAVKLGRVWEMWTPESFRAVSLTAETGLANVREVDTDARLFLYSGGVDSSYMLLQPETITPGSYALTIHGLDYKPANESGFKKLIEKTDPLLHRLGLKRIVVKTNLGRVVKNLALNHGFCLAGVGFLFRHMFSSVCLATDFDRVQSMLSFPWGTNFLTNDFFSGSDFKLLSMNSDVTRTVKVAYLAKDLDACNSIAFCTDTKYRPENCGQCNKCIRTKAMFLIENGSLPPIFKCGDFDKRHVSSLSLSKRSEMAFFSELLSRAKDLGVEGRLLGIQNKYDKSVKRLRRIPKNVIQKRLGKLRIKLIWSGLWRT